METATIVAVAVSHMKIILALTGIEPVLSALRGQRVNQLHHSAVTAKDYKVVRT